MLTPASFLTATLRIHPYGGHITRILSAAIQAVEPGQAVRRFVQHANNQLIINGYVYPLGEIEQLHILGLGKATHAMSLALADLSPRSLLIPKKTFPPPWAGCEVHPGGHPVPDENSLKAGHKALEFVHNLGENDLLLCLISGGGSALMTAPHLGLCLDDLKALTSALLACGARIDEINTLRRHLDQVKGGGLARAAAPARVVSLILSDVIGNPLEAIASGPTAPDPTTRADALEILDKYRLRNKIPAAILDTLETFPETPKLGAALFNRVQNIIIGSNFLAALAALTQAEAEGFQTRFLGDNWQGEARKAAKILCDQLKTSHERPLCMVAGGETTVTVSGTGLGGRNQELALAAVEELTGLENVMLISLATDGEDGPTDAAGAVVTGETKKRAQSLNLDAQTFLRENDAFHFFELLGDLLKPGPSGTNVNDLTFLFAF